jgi:hypothetical protein
MSIARLNTDKEAPNSVFAHKKPYRHPQAQGLEFREPTLGTSRRLMKKANSNHNEH